MFKIIKERFNKRKRLAKKQPEILRYEELEQRVLFSADVVPGLDTAAVEEQGRGHRRVRPHRIGRERHQILRSLRPDRQQPL